MGKDRLSFAGGEEYQVINTNNYNKNNINL